MKSHILFFLTFSLIAGQLFAQQAPLAVADLTETPTASIENSVAEIARQHNQIAISQISNHLVENIYYPEVMAPYAYDGTLTLQVIIGKSGKISRVTVQETDLPEVFTETGISIMRELKRLKLNERLYQGTKSVLVPIHFSL